RILQVPHMLVCAALALSAAACGESESVAPVAAARVVGETNSDAAPRGAPGITALTWNVYLGADIGRVLAARTAEQPAVLATEPATRVAYDFLQLVIDSLHARGVDYTAAAVDRTSDLQVPVIAGVDASGQPTLAGVRWTDGDAVLVRADVPYVDAKSGVYAASQ